MFGYKEKQTEKIRKEENIKESCILFAVYKEHSFFFIENLLCSLTHVYSDIITGADWCSIVSLGWYQLYARR